LYEAPASANRGRRLSHAGGNRFCRRTGNLTLDELTRLNQSIRSACIEGFGDLAKGKMDEGWPAYMVTFMFRQLRGSSGSIRTVMLDEIGRVYSTLLTRVTRNPRKPASSGSLPIMIGSLDLPVYKRQRDSFADVAVNGGLHAHAVLLVPPTSRLRESIPDHFARLGPLYHGSRIARIDVRPIDHDPERATAYVLKGISSRRLQYDDSMIVYPRAMSEFSPKANDLRPHLLAGARRLAFHQMRIPVRRPA
jgi:hypothetical protein